MEYMEYRIVMTIDGVTATEEDFDTRQIIGGFLDQLHPHPDAAEAAAARWPKYLRGPGAESVEVDWTIEEVEPAPAG